MNKNELINSHMPLAICLAKRKKRSVGRNIYYEELESAAYRGLVDAAQKYEAVRGEFPRYAAPRIIGEMEDYLRELQWGNKTRPVSVKSIQDVDTNVLVETKNDIDVAIAAMMKYVPEEAQQIFSWYYHDEMTLEQIGDKLDLTRSGVFKIMQRYKNQIRKHKEEIFAKRCN